MQIKLSQVEIKDILKQHLTNKGYEVQQVYDDYKETTEYEYYGTLNESRKEIEVKKHTGLIFEVNGI